MQSTISRRGFVQVGATVAVASAATATAGIAPVQADAVEAVAAETVVAVGSTVDAPNRVGVGLGGNILKTIEGVTRTVSDRWSWATKPDPIADDQIAETKECDILILGAGSAGVPAAAYAANAGAKVIVLTKGPVTESCGGNTAGYNSPHDAEFGFEYDPVSVRKEFAKYTDGLANIPMMCGIMDRSGEAMEWVAGIVAENADLRLDIISDADLGWGAHTHACYLWADTIDELAGSAKWYAGFPKALNTLKDNAVANGAEFLWSTPAVELLQDESGAVIGAVGKAEDGTYVKVLASKGVLLACGDFASNPEMIECYSPFYTGGQTRNPYGTNTGDGHRLGMWAGGVMEFGVGCMGGLSTSHDFYNDVYAPFGSSPFVRVNKDGHRYVNETLYDEMYTGIAVYHGDVCQRDRTIFQICDSNYGNVVDTEKFETMVEKGVIYKADTLEELAEIAGIDGEELAKTIERLNDLGANGADLDFGVDADILANMAVKDAPFYAMERLIVNTATMQGLIANTHLQVVDAHEKPIDGLYAAGNCLGGKFGFMYPDAMFTATQKMAAIVGGMLAVKDMLGEWDSAF